MRSLAQKRREDAVALPKLREKEPLLQDIRALSFVRHSSFVIRNSTHEHHVFGSDPRGAGKIAA